MAARRQHTGELDDRWAGGLTSERILGREPQFCAWSNHLAKLEKAGAPVVELHWSIERPTSPFRIDLEGLWLRSQSAALEGAPVRLLSPEDLVLHLVLHLSYHHRFERSALKGLVDIATVIDRLGSELDWDALARRASAWGASGYLYTTLRLAGEIFGARVPASVFQTLPHERADEEMIPVARRYMLELHVAVPATYLQLARGGSARDRARVVLAKVFLSRDRMEAVYGLRAGSPLVYPCYGLVSSPSRHTVKRRLWDHQEVLCGSPDSPSPRLSRS